MTYSKDGQLEDTNATTVDGGRLYQAHTTAAPSWANIFSRKTIKLYAGDIPDLPYYDDYIGLSIARGDHRHILHDITRSFPIPDNSVDTFQAEDVLEHIQYDLLPAVVNEIFRILKPGSLFRLSVPDYGCDVLQERSLKDSSGKIIFDPGGGGTPENPGHVWFPRIDNVRNLLDKTDFALSGSIEYLHYYNMDGTFITNPIDYVKGHVDRTPDFDERVKFPYRPMSMVIDLIKADAKDQKPPTISISDKSDGCLSSITASGYRCLFINTYYYGFLGSFYAKKTTMLSASYQEQKTLLQAQCFGDSDFYSRGLQAAGWHADDLIVNCEPLQQAWAREHNSAAQGLELFIEQVKQIKPDCVYLQDIGLLTKELHQELRPHTELIVGQIAYPLSAQTYLQGFDVIFSSFPHFVSRFRAAGITAYYQPLAFEPHVLKQITNFPYSKRPVDCSFVGGISPAHGTAYQLLETLAARLPIHFWGYGAETLPPDSAVKAAHHGEVWAKEMFYLLGASKITINRHIDVAENYANNMRLFEATGCGALLITDYKDNLSELFDVGKEILAYRSPEECIELVRHYLAHPEEAEKIAAAGQKRTLCDHTYHKRMQRTAKVLSRHLRYRREEGSLEMPARISDGYQKIDRSAVTTALETAWKNPDIPRQQRALVQQQLLEMYRGNTPQLFQILADLLAPLVHDKLSVLEIGCASGYYYEALDYLLHGKISYTGADYSEAMIKLARDYYPDASFFVADGSKLPIADRSFRVVISGCVLLHTANYPQHIAETCRVAEKWIVAHRTPISRVSTTTCLSKMAYGVETVEFRFNEQEFLTHFAQHGFVQKQAVTYDGKPEHDEYETSYLFERV